MDGSVNTLPRLREELRLLRGGIGLDGTPTWVIHDPVADNYVQITFEAFQVLSNWNASNSYAELSAQVQQGHGRTIDESEITELLRLGQSLRLFENVKETAWQELYAASLPKTAWWMSLIHNYIFFKVPLFTPDKFLAATWPVVRLFFTPAFVIISVIAGMFGLYLVSRQWDSFIHSFPYFFTLEGAVVGALAVVFVKSFHELGHGYMAHRFGVRTKTIGVAFMVMAPMLYADVTHAWSLSSRRQRMLIDLAGIMVELLIGLWCLALWPFLTDGPFRSAVFVAATVSWTMSLAVNLNPLMRFDGYFILSDLLGMPNLQPRAFAHMRYTLRRILFGNVEQPPETFAPVRSIFVLLVAVVTTIYRLILYIGIALLVYHFFIKLLGLLMLAVEIFYFILAPVVRELRAWFAMRNKIMENRRSIASGTIALALFACLFIPISRQVRVPAMLEAEAFQYLYPAEAAQIVTISARNGQVVKENDTLFILDSPSIENDRKLARAGLASAKARLARIATDAKDLSLKSVLREEIAKFESELAGLDRKQKDLVVRAPFTGTLADVNPNYYEGQWVAATENLGVVIGGSKTVSRGYVDADDLPRLVRGQKAYFVPDDISAPSLDMRLADVSRASAAAIELPALTSDHGGLIPVMRDAANKPVPVTARFLLRSEAEGQQPVTATRRGLLLISADAESLASRMLRQIVRVLIRESGA